MRIFLIGFMASGKSHWCKQLAQRLLLPFVDLDKTIENSCQMSISEIFNTKGETEFRNIETAVLEEQIANQSEFVMACGGGIMLSDTNRRLLKSAGITVFVDTPTQTIINRLLNDTGNRPLLENLTPNELESKVKRMMEGRRNNYESANIFFYPEHETLGDLVNKLTRKIHRK